MLETFGIYVSNLPGNRSEDVWTESVRKLRLTYHFVMLNICEASPDNRSKREILHSVPLDLRKMKAAQDFSDGPGGGKEEGK